MKHFTKMVVAPTPCTLYFCLAGDEQCISSALRKDYKVPDLEDIPEMDEVTTCGCVEHNGSALVMIISPKAGTNTLVHECVHAAGFAWEQVGGDAEITLSGEVLAYTVDTLFVFAEQSFNALMRERELESMIRKNPKGGYDVLSSSGRKLGHHPTRPEAVEQLKAIEAKKHGKK